MKFAILILMLGNFVFAQAKEIVVKARLLEQPYSLKANDLYKPVYIFKYQVQKVIKGELKEKIIYVGHYNPAISRSKINDAMKDKVKGNLKNFVTGEFHELTLSDDFEKLWEGAVEDEYFDDESPRWFALVTNLAK